MYVKFIKLLMLLLIVTSCNSANQEEEQQQNQSKTEAESLLLEEDENKLYVEISGEGEIIYYSNGAGYRYGPSIMKYDDGSMDIWLSAPGNSGSQWDWITYTHSDDGINWSNETIALKPTPGSKDQCSVCDPGVIFFNDYYYLAYTATDYYEGKGTNNSAFVARSKYPYGPFEKWDGEGWGGYPEPIIKYEGDKSGWGIGEVSFVIKDDELYIYHTCFDTMGGSTRLAKADLSENWPSTIVGDEVVCGILHQDSMDVVYADNLDTFLGFAVLQRMGDKSKLVMYESEYGNDFKQIDTDKGTMKEYSHNVGISKNPHGHLNTDDNNVISYGFGQKWGDWSAIVQKIEFKIVSEQK